MNCHAADFLAGNLLLVDETNIADAGRWKQSITPSSLSTRYLTIRDASKVE